MSKLYAVLLGGSGGPGRLSEDHETVFVVADTEKSARQQARAKWAGHGKGHVDALECLDVIDGHRVMLEGGAAPSQGVFISYNDEPFDEGND